MNMRKYFFILLIIIIFTGLIIFSASADDNTTATPSVNPQNSPENLPVNQDVSSNVRSFSEDYVLGAEDIISIHVWRHNDLTNPNVTVRKNGFISFPFTGDIKVAGLTCGQLQDKLTESLLPYIKNPKVSVNVVKGRAFRISVMGVVVRPGVYDMLEPEITITEALALAGGTRPEAAIHRSLIQRGDETITVDMLKILRYGEVENNVTVREGDIIIIPEMNHRVAVVGEVNRPGVYPLQEGDSLLEAISAAGWFNGKARVSRIEIIRRGANGTEERIDVNFRQLGNKQDSHLLQKFALKGGDIVYVPELKGLSFDMWIRTISGLYMIKNFFPNL
jgi:polysaccharide biosynthesis/export protein